MAEPATSRAKRLRMRSWRRGTKEMDLILGPFADAHLGELTDDQIETYDALLSENDHDLYLWVSGREAAPAAYGELIGRIAEAASVGKPLRP